MNYRASHQKPEKARSYQESFAQFPYRRIVWEWEQDVLNKIVHDEILRGLSPEKPGLRYLDFACGTGRVLSALEEHMQESYGVDISEAMLAVAKENVRRSKLIRCDLSENDVFAENYFDLITAFRFFLKAEQELRESILRAFGKILKKDGRLVLNIHMNKGCLLEKELRAYRAVRHMDQQSFPSLSVEETKQMLGAFHFKVTHTFHYGVLPIYREDRKLFVRQVAQLERLFSRWDACLPVSRYVIYVCQPDSSL